MHNLSTFFQFLRHLTTDTVQFIKICQNCDQHTQHDRDPDKADFNMRQCTRDLYRISYIAAFFQEDSDNETCQSHSAFYEKSLECSNQSHSCVSQCIDKFCYQHLRTCRSRRNSKYIGVKYHQIRSHRTEHQVTSQITDSITDSFCPFFHIRSR